MISDLLHTTIMVGNKPTQEKVLPTDVWNAVVESMDEDEEEIRWKGN